MGAGKHFQTSILVTFDLPEAEPRTDPHLKLNPQVGLIHPPNIKLASKNMPLKHKSAPG
jgi:hypothetical protein